jgi:DNA-binding response OmpR family regulator
VGGGVQGDQLEEVPPADFGCALHFPSSFSPGLKMPSVLLLDADRNFREALAIALRLDGFQVAVTAAAEDAIRWLDAARFDACAADARTPGLDGVADAASRTGARLVITGPHPELLALAVRRLAGAAALSKPFGAADLAARMARVPATSGG